MAKSLVIVESPAKAKTIQKYLGSGYTVKASMGHVRDLPQKSLGVDIKNNFEPKYENLKTRTAALKQLKTAAKTADKVYLAPDPDREGEAIAWHISEALKLPASRSFRVTFNEITKAAIKEAFKHPSKIDMAKVNAQQARRILDRIVGYQLSPLLWKKVAKGLSAGRVQSVAVRLIVEREKEIAAFTPEEFWKIIATFHPQGSKGGAVDFTAELTEWDGKSFKVSKGDDANKIVAALEKATHVVESIERKEQKTSPLPPLNTSLLQQQAAVQLHFTARRTMRVAQQLYEGVDIGEEGSVGLITYMRTDSFHVSTGAIQECRDYVKERFGDKFVHDKPRVFKSRKGAQEAHEAVRPTSVFRTPDKVRPYVTAEQAKLYELVWRRFVATQMSDALYDVTTMNIKSGKGLFKARGRVCLFKGHTEVSGAPDEKDVQPLPVLKEGTKLDLKKLDPSQHFTKPPARYNEASLVRTLEKEGIGRPSTYATIISTIQDRGYVKQEKRVFFATDLGVTVTDLLLESFPKIMEVKFTSEMEEKLDKIEEEHSDWVAVLTEFYAVFKESLDVAAVEMKRVKGVESDEKCPECGKPLLERWSKFGKFLGCSGYPECRYIKGGAAGEQAETDVKCQKCGKPMVVKRGRAGAFLGCSGYPDCRNTLKIGPDGKPLPPPEPTDQKCEKCGSMMVIRTGARGRFLACTGFPKCRNIKALPTGIKCPKADCGGEVVYRKGRGRRKGFYACTKYPECDFTSSELPEKS